MKMEVTEVDLNSEDSTGDANKDKFIMDAKSKGYDIEHLYGADVVLRGKEYEVVGFNKNSPKNRMNIRKKENGVVYKCSIETVEGHLK